MTDLPTESFIIQRLQEGGWRVIHRRADLTDLPIADFVSYDEAQEWVSWKSGHPRINPYVMADAVRPLPTRPLEIAIEPKSKADGERLIIALARLAAEDPAFGFSTDHESGQAILKGVSELDLGAKVDVLRQTYNIDARVGSPQVAFRETITQPAGVEYVHKKQSGGTGQFAAIKLRVEPNEPGKGCEFVSRIVDGAVPEKYIAGVEKGIESVLSSGAVAGFPLVDVKVILVDGKYHDVDSSAQAFEIAARAAFREALRKGKPVLLEPIMKVEVMTAEDHVGSIIGDLKSRRGQIQGQDVRGHATVITAMVPLTAMFGYAKTLREEGRAAFTMQFDHYAAAPRPEDDPPFRPAIGMRA
jgi:elongation factor G